MILQTMILMKDQKQIEKLATELCENINSNKWMSTQTTAWSLLALNEYMNKLSPTTLKLIFFPSTIKPSSL
jgi:hypothetical protein